MILGEIMVEGVEVMDDRRMRWSVFTVGSVKQGSCRNIADLHSFIDGNSAEPREKSVLPDFVLRILIESTVKPESVVDFVLKHRDFVIDHRSERDIKRSSVDQIDRKLVTILLSVLFLLFPKGIDESRVQSARQFTAIKILLVGIKRRVFR